MGRIISGSNMESTPLVQVREKGKVFIGTKIGQKPGKKGGFIFEATYEEGTTAAVVVGNGTKDAQGKNVYVACSVDPGDKISIFGDTQLNDKLGKVEAGEKFKITSNGKIQTKNGNWMNDYIVEVL